MIARWSTASARASATKRCRLAKARSTPAGSSRPVTAMPRPRADMTFSLSSTTWLAPSRSKTTSRSELEPTSTTATRPEGASELLSGIGASLIPEVASTRDGRQGARPSGGAPQRPAAPGQAGIGHEVGMGGKPVLLGPYPRIRAVGSEVPALQCVTQIGHHDLVEHLAMHRHIFDRHQRLDPPIEIAQHPVGGADEHLGLVGGQLVAIAEADDAAMFEKAADDALDPDVLGHAGHARPQTADAAHHQVDHDPGLRGLVEQVDQRRVNERIELDPDLRGPAGSGMGDLRLDQF